MNTRDAINAGVILAIAAAMLGAVAASVRRGNGDGSNVQRERCYGVAKAGQNDCANALHSCATQSASDNDKREWIALPKGSCERLAGGQALERSSP
jgi:uncharacterized membrane protein